MAGTQANGLSVRFYKDDISKGTYEEGSTRTYTLLRNRAFKQLCSMGARASRKLDSTVD